MEINGLSDKEVDESKSKYGTNVIVEAEPETFMQKFLEGFKDPMIILLLVIACIMITLYVLSATKVINADVKIYESIGTIVAILLVTIISAKTEMASDKEYRKLKNSTKKDAVKVYRNGTIVELTVDDIVVGDYVILQSGDKIPADGILVDGSLKVDNSALNGETEECKKSAVPSDFVYEDKPIQGDTFVDKHSLFRGAVIYNGEGVMEVKKVGMETMMGKMAADMADEEVMSPLKVKLAKLADQISKFGYIGAIVIALALMIHFIAQAGGVSDYFTNTAGMDIFNNIIEAVTLAVVIIVCAVPEGLPLMISLVLMQNTSKMLQHNVLVRKPIGIETAGSLNVLFSDKTGTITKGHLEVVEFFDANADIIKNPFENDTDETKIGYNLKMAIGKNTSAMFDKEHNVIGGNLTDKALMDFLTEDRFNKLANIKVDKFQGFNSAIKYTASEINETGKTFYKGAPERLLSVATKYIDKDGNVKPLDKDVINKKIDGLAEKAMRVLSFGVSTKPLVENELPDDLIIIGFVGIRDDVRPEAKQVIGEVLDAGIQVVMITGDRKETAVAIGKDAGLIRNETDVVLTSEELNKMTDEEVKEVLPRIRVISRALPTDKSRLVRLTQELNLVCGMTGDGVNDAPALKRADVGFAMGSGTDVAKETGDIVILDDNFKSIKDAILYGRTIYNNILKFCKFQLVINVSAVLVSAISPFIGVEEPLKVTHLLWVNLVMDALGALALGAEPALERYMKAKPRRRDESIVSKPMLAQVSIMGVWLTIISMLFLKLPFFKDTFFAGNDDKFMTGYFCMFIFCAVANGFNVRNNNLHLLEGLKDNPGFCKIMGIIVAVQIAITFIGGELFQCTPFGIKGWACVVVMALTMIPIDMIRKLITNAITKNKGQTAA